MTSRSITRLSRALGIPLTPKSNRYFERRPYPPGVHGRRRRNPSAYRLQLLEKQRLRGQYDLRERQFRRIVNEAIRRPGKAGDTLIELLERRLDAVVLRSGLARTIYQARQMATHGHITVDSQKVDRPSCRLRPGQTVEVRPSSRHRLPFVAAAAGSHAPGGPTPAYLDVDLQGLRVTLLSNPRRQDVPVVCDEQRVVEFYAR